VKPKSRLGFAGDDFANKDQDGSNSSSSRKQFAETPKFSSKSSYVPEIDNTAHPDRLPSSIESINDASQQEQHKEGEMLLEPDESAQHIHEDLPPSTKRQRIEDPDRATSRRYAFAPLVPSHLQTSTPANSEADVSITPSRPIFRLPVTVHPEPSEPLPDAFSPHRRRQRFLPGGMAAQVQQWIVEAAQSVGKHSQSTAGADPLQAVVLESSGSSGTGMVLAKATAGNQRVRLLLAGSGKNQSASSIKQSDVLAVKAPSWNIELEGEPWIVGVDWCILR
jgi:hypothetical protein